jgi:hypothetical protein
MRAIISQALAASHAEGVIARSPFDDFGKADVARSRNPSAMSKPACIDPSAFPAFRMRAAQSLWSWR